MNVEKALLYLYLIYGFKKQILQGANVVLFNPLVPKDHNSECQNILFPVQMKPVNDSLSKLADFIFAPSTLMG